MSRELERTRKNSDKFRQLLGNVNDRLKSAALRVRVEAVGQSLYLRAMVPDPSGEAWTQRRIAIGLKATAPMLPTAEGQAKALAGQLEDYRRGFWARFEWERWGLAPASVQATTIGGLVEQLLKSKKALAPSSVRAYRRAFGRLPSDQPLTEQILVDSLASLSETPRTQLLCYQKYRQLAEFAGLSVNLADYRGNYSPALLTARSIPDDDQVMMAWRSIEHPGWRWVLGMLICFGLRNHEVFYLDLDDLAAGGHSVFVTEGKTGPHTAWARSPEDVDLFGLRSAPCLPRVSFASHDQAGGKVTKYLNRKRLGGWTPYDLRHLWAISTAVGPNALDPVLAAAAQGHSQRVHEGTYQRWVSPESQRRAYLAAHGLLE
jgi:integrase